MMLTGSAASRAAPMPRQFGVPRRRRLRDGHRAQPSLRATGFVDGASSASNGYNDLFEFPPLAWWCCPHTEFVRPCGLVNQWLANEFGHLFHTAWTEIAGLPGLVTRIRKTGLPALAKVFRLVAWPDNDSCLSCWPLIERIVTATWTTPFAAEDRPLQSLEPHGADRARDIQVAVMLAEKDGEQVVHCPSFW